MAGLAALGGLVSESTEGWLFWRKIGRRGECVLTLRTQAPSYSGFPLLWIFLGNTFSFTFFFYFLLGSPTHSAEMDSIRSFIGYGKAEALPSDGANQALLEKLSADNKKLIEENQRLNETKRSLTSANQTLNATSKGQASNITELSTANQTLSATSKEQASTIAKLTAANQTLSATSAKLSATVSGMAFSYHKELEPKKRNTREKPTGRTVIDVFFSSNCYAGLWDLILKELPGPVQSLFAQHYHFNVIEIGQGLPEVATTTTACILHMETGRWLMDITEPVFDEIRSKISFAFFFFHFLLSFSSFIFIFLNFHIF